MRVSVPKPGRGVGVAALLGVFVTAVLVALIRRGVFGAVTRRCCTEREHGGRK